MGSSRREGLLLLALTLLGTPLLNAPARAQALTPSVTPGAAAPYVLSPDDQINISVLGHGDLTESVTILPDGTFQYPIVGDVHAAGLTVQGLTRTLTQGLSTDLNTPQVNVTVVQTRSRLISVLGDVHAPGQYPVKPGTHLLDVLAACGGPAQAAQLTTATLVTDGGTQSTILDIPGLMNNTDMADNVPLEAGDVLLVQARSPEAGQVQVIGEVQHPGPFPVPAAGLSVEALLAETGGAADDGALTQAQILHDGKTIPIDLHPLLSDLNAPVGQTVVMPGDVLLVPANHDKIAILGEVHQPQDYLIPDGRPVNVGDAVALAGGPTPEADRTKAYIVRQDSGAPAAAPPTVIPVDLNALLAGKTTVADVPLRPGDILYVPTRHHAPGFNPLTALGSISPLAFLLNR